MVHAVSSGVTGIFKRNKDAINEAKELVKKQILGLLMWMSNFGFSGR